MASLVLDPYAVAVPAVSEGREAAERYVNSIVTWSALTQEPWLTLLMTDDTVIALNDAGCFPVIHEVATLCMEHGLDEVSPEDVANALARLLDAARSCEESVGVSDVLLDPLTLLPDVPNPRAARSTGGSGRNATCVRDATRRLFALHALVAHCAADVVRDRELASADLFCGGLGVHVSGTAVIIERTGSCLLPALPDPFVLPATHVSVRDGPRPALGAIDPVLLWIADPSEDARRAAIRIKLLVEDPSLTWDETGRFTLGCEFVASLGRHGFDRQEARVRKLLATCAETVLGRNDAATHALREGDGPTAPQRLRGDDKAWRRDIDYEFHLHYWELPGRRFEFGNVVSHNVFVIPYCR